MSAKDAIGDALVHPGQHAARAALDDVRHATSGHRPHRRRPAHRVSRLLRQCNANRIGFGMFQDVDIVNDRDARWHDGDLRQALGQAPGSGLEQRTVKRRRDRQQHAALGTFRPGQRNRTLHGFAVSGDDNLPRRIEIDRLDDLPLRRLTACLRNGVVVAAHDRSHRAHPGRNRLLHRLCAKSDQRHRVAKRQCPRRDQCGVFTEAMSRHHHGPRAAGGEPGAIDGNSGCQHHRLRIGREIQRFRGTFGRQRPQVVAQRGGRLGKGLAHDRMRGESVHHSDRLRALPRKYECKFHDVTI